MHAAASIERVLSHGKRQTTYKLAVLRALVEHVTEQPAQEPRNGLHQIPVVDLARRVLAYFWRPVLQGVPQGRTGKEAISRATRDLASSELTLRGIELSNPKAGLSLASWIEEAAELPKPVVAALLEIRRTLLEQPLRYLHNVPGSSVTVFSLFTVGGPGVLADYEAHRKAAPGKRKLTAASWTGLLESERSSLLLSARAYEEISELRFWLRDAIVLRWARECEVFSAGQVSVETFDLEPLERDVGLMSKIKGLYEGLGLTRCLYSGKPLPSSWDLDHLLPWSRFPVNLFWNLVPSLPELNRGKGGKFDLLPEFEAGLEDRYRDFLYAVLEAKSDFLRAQLGATYRRYFQETYRENESSDETVRRLLSVVDASWWRLEAAGVGRWSPPPRTGTSPHAVREDQPFSSQAAHVLSLEARPSPTPESGL
jgi:HNH endonuclease